MPDTRRPGPKWKKVLLLQLLLVPILFVVGDLAVRFATGYDGEATRLRIDRIVESMQSGVPDPGRSGPVGKIERADLRLHPYTGFGPRQLVLSHNQELRLSREERPDGEYRIMILGGSVAAGFGNPTSGGIDEVRKVLERDHRFAGRKIRFLGQGYGAYKQPQQLILASYLLGIGVRPHAVISLDGFNEVALSMHNSSVGMNPCYPSFAQWAHLTSRWASEPDLMIEALEDIRSAREACVRIAETAERFGLHRSSLLGPRVLGRLQHEQRRFAKASKRYSDLLTRREGFGPIAGPTFDPDAELVAEDAVRMWTEATRSLDAICERRGIFFLSVLQPTLHDNGSKVLTEEEIETGKAHESWVRGVALGYPMLRAAGRSLREKGVHWADGSMAFQDVGRTLYFDPCHFNQFGYRVLGRLIGKAFLEQLPAGDLPR